MTEEEFKHYEAYLSYEYSLDSKIRISVNLQTKNKIFVTVDIPDDITGSQLKRNIMQEQVNLIHYVLEKYPSVLPILENTSNENTCSS